MLQEFIDGLGNYLSMSVFLAYLAVYEGIVSRQYGVRGVPTHCLVSRDGMILCYGCRNLELMLSTLFDEKK
jgi:hypothetical protein